MGEWKTVKLAEVLRYRKGNILINNDEEYSLCRVQLHRRGVVLREKKMGSQIKTKKQQVCRAGDLVVAEMDAKFGGYGFIPDHLEGTIVSSHYYLYELDKNKITQQYFEILIKTDFIQNQIEAKGSTNYSSIRAWEFLDYEIPLQSIPLQNSIAAKYLKHSRFKEAFGVELIAQLKYLSQLRQRILQDAIEGKLTAKWRDKHPEFISGDNHASKLLEKIKAEKECLIKEGKIKKDKPLAPITEAEKPFPLPNGWAWVRFSEICEIATNCVSPYDYPNHAHLAPDNIEKCTGRLLECKTVKDDNVISVNHLFYPGMLVYSKVRPRLRKVAKVDFEGLCSADMYPLVPKCNPDYLKTVMLSNFFDGEVYRFDNRVKMPKINQDQLGVISIPLAPLADQQAIVERVDKLMTMIDELEKQVSERKEQSEMLMQSVLREAFAMV